jgi:hypothetical protein
LANTGSGDGTSVPLRRALTVAAVLLLAAACVNHPVGPARSQSSYEAKAVTTAESALSAVQTVRLVAAAAAEGNAFGAYTSVSVSEQEDTLGGLRGTFLSIQPPPGAAAESLRAELSSLLTRAFDDVGAVRIEARRGHLDSLDTVAAPLAEDADALEAFVEEWA